MKRKRIFQLVFLFFVFKLSSQVYQTTKIKFDKDSLCVLEKKTIYSLNSKELKTIISKSKTTYSLFISYAFWCSSCREEIPGIIEFSKKNSDKLSLYLLNIEKDNTERQFETKKYLEEINYLNATFMISEEYGKGKKKKYKNFMMDILNIKNISNQYLGLAEVILYKNNNIVYKSTFYENDFDKITNITTILNQY